ncbi:hypothetical protein FRUB_06442 [Fimbriiglobus ruber]|uniref:Uncharacterized protein n=1 Tax=Fimbriiglobus ruber TaxID=1908690 RepID=A0A225D791_9BACT|nr:hypothetical protein FRUB_06442 [Fimbriiglobus ruber]
MAELKLGVHRVCTPRRLGDLHGYEAVAELKRLKSGVLGLKLFESPRL